MTGPVLELGEEEKKEMQERIERVAYNTTRALDPIRALFLTLR